MKRFTTTIMAGAICVNLASCNVTATSAAATVDDVQTAAVSICGFLPTAATILELFTADPTLITAAQVAKLICSVVTKKSGGQWIYEDVIIHGEFVNRSARRR
jgi:hypothetical protein